MEEEKILRKLQLLVYAKQYCTSFCSWNKDCDKCSINSLIERLKQEIILKAG